MAADQIRSGHNVGSLFRIGDAFGIEQIILGGYTVQPPHPEIQKQLLAHLKRLPGVILKD